MSDAGNELANELLAAMQSLPSSDPQPLMFGEVYEGNFRAYQSHKRRPAMVMKETSQMDVALKPITSQKGKRAVAFSKNELPTSPAARKLMKNYSTGYILIAHQNLIMQQETIRSSAYEFRLRLPPKVRDRVRQKLEELAK